MWRPSLQVVVRRGDPTGAAAVGEALPSAVGAEHVTLTAGESFGVEVTAGLSSSRRLRAARVVLEERETLLPTAASVGSGGNKVVRVRRLAERQVSLVDEGGRPTHHEPGELRFDARLAVPDDAAPDYDGYLVAIDHTLLVELDVALGLDGRVSLPVRIEHPPAPPVPLAPCVRVAPGVGGGGILGKQARFLEVGLVTNAAAPGQTLRGGLALSTSTTGGHLEVSLVGHEGTSEAHRHTEYVAVPQLMAGEVFRFALVVPWTAAPSFHTPTLSLTWHLALAFEGDGRKTIAPPLPVLLTTTPATTATELPPLGRSRWASVFETSVREAGSATGERVYVDGAALVGERGATRYRIAGGEPTAGEEELATGSEVGVMHITVRWPSFHLGLALEKKTGLLTSRATTEARFRSHAKTIAGDPALSSMLQRFEAYALDDHGGTLTLAESPLVPGRLVEAVKHVKSLVDLLHERVALLEPDREVAAESEAMGEFAPSVAGTFQPGALAMVDAHLDGEPFSLGAWWGVTNVGPALIGLEVVVPCGIEGQQQLERRLADVLQRKPLPPRVSEIRLRPDTDPRQRGGSELVAFWLWDPRRPMREVVPVVRYVHGFAEELFGVTRAGPYR